MEYDKYLLAETNSFTKENGTNFDCTLNKSFDLIPVYLNPDPWEEYLETTIEKVTETETGIFQYDFVIDNKNIEEDDESIYKKTQRFSLEVRVKDIIEIKRLFHDGDENYFYVSLLVEITQTTEEKLSYKIVGILEDDATEEDYAHIPREYIIGEKLPYLPRNAVYSRDVWLKGIKKAGEDFIMILFIKADKSEEELDQIMLYSVRKGSHLEFDEFEIGIVCFVRPDRKPVDLEVVDVSEERITLRKC